MTRSYAKSDGKHSARIRADFMRNFVAMGAPSRVMEIPPGHICGVCGHTATRMLVFVTGIVNSCEKHYSQFTEKRRELWRRELYK